MKTTILSVIECLCLFKVLYKSIQHYVNISLAQYAPWGMPEYLPLNDYPYIIRYIGLYNNFTSCWVYIWRHPPTRRTTGCWLPSQLSLPSRHKTQGASWGEEGEDHTRTIRHLWTFGRLLPIRHSWTFELLLHSLIILFQGY